MLKSQPLSVNICVYGEKKMSKATKTMENTWRIDEAGGVRFFLFCGKKRAALIDSGIESPDARMLAESLTDLPLILINTHGDRDHISGNGMFDEVYMSPAEEENYRGRNGKGRIVPLREGDVIDLGDRPLRVIDLPGHTPGSIALLDEKNRILVSGDTVQDSIVYMFGPFRNMDRYIESLEHLLGFEGLYDEIYTNHGSFPAKPELVGKLLEGAGEIREGKAKGEPWEVHGNPVTLYRFPYAGFYCEAKEEK